MSLLSKRYATAIFEVAEKNSATDAVAQDLGRLDETLQSAGMRALVMSPETTGVRRRQVLEQMTDQAHQLTKNLVGVILKRRRQEALLDLNADFQELLRASRGEITGVVETAKPIDELQLRKVEENAAAWVGEGRKLKLAVVENPELIGGIRIRVGNTLYDGSVKRTLDELAEKLMNAPLQ